LSPPFFPLFSCGSASSTQCARQGWSLLSFVFPPAGLDSKEQHWFPFLSCSMPFSTKTRPQWSPRFERAPFPPLPAASRWLIVSPGAKERPLFFSPTPPFTAKTTLPHVRWDHWDELKNIRELPPWFLLTGAAARWAGCTFPHPPFLSVSIPGISAPFSPVRF